MISRRAFLLGAAGSCSLAVSESVPEFRTADTQWQTAYDRALAILAANVQVLPRYDKPVLIEGANYAGIWMECGPHEALIYRKFRPDVARNSHFTFFALQRPDGFNSLPTIRSRKPVSVRSRWWYRSRRRLLGDFAHATGDNELLDTAYRACAAWDKWLMGNRNTRGTGLIEGFCTYDTGHDNSPRWKGIPLQCPDKDAKRHAAISTLPRLCPDLSATTYGARMALAEMARALGKSAESDRWAESADQIRSLIVSRLYVEKDAAFYDLDALNHFVTIRSDILSRVCGEHIPDQPMFAALWTRQIHNPAAFWAKWPLPSVALDDPMFVRPIPANSWGGASQALTALRACRWFEYYGRPSEFAFLMDRWCGAIQRDMTFRQQLDPLTGAFTHEGPPDYSPTALLMLDYTWRLAGVCEEGDSLEWNVRVRDTSAALDRRFSAAAAPKSTRYDSASGVPKKLVGTSANSRRGSRSVWQDARIVKWKCSRTRESSSDARSLLHQGERPD